MGGPPTIPISRRTIALHSTNRAASSATNRLTASVSPAINPVTSTRDGDKPRRQFGDKPAYGERKSGDKPPL